MTVERLVVLVNPARLDPLVLVSQSKNVRSAVFVLPSSLYQSIRQKVVLTLEAIARRVSEVGEVRGLGPMRALELVRDPETKEPVPELALATATSARDRGLILLSCGLHGNVVRILVPLVASDEELDHGLDLLEESLIDACAR